ncbi:hypothetical protein C8F04DRAFT_1192637 [Mycena alexandri]|uniref:Uncharacterized protein n=1 Tax=Mycena alexandri TaxID=1745969 RepID=A0AAD6WRB0_9AGAR|nr:hypothetical protein C8F04DRAFT_1192637 [Mycena alexandri]
MPKSTTRARKTPTVPYNSTWEQCREAAIIAEHRHILALALAFGVTEAQVVEDREAWLRAPNWEPSRYGWEAGHPGYDTGSGWGPTPDPSTTDHEWGTGDGWGTGTQQASTTATTSGWGTGAPAMSSFLVWS